jgi:hypothetical protein
MLVSETKFLLNVMPMGALTTLESERHSAEGLTVTVVV